MEVQALRALSAWFETHQRILPWRDSPTLYRVWISEIMLQQTQVATVIPYFERFMERFPTVESLASAPLDDVLLLWSGLGYYSRARNLHRAAQAIVTQGGFPRDREGWLELPGIGGYTAGAILSIALDQPVPILDGNVERVLSRIAKIDRQKGDGDFKSQLWKLSEEVVSQSAAVGLRPSVINQALMELGAILCTPKRPACGRCPWAKICLAHRDGLESEYPPPRPRKEWIKVEEEVHCVLNDREQVLLHQREAGEWRAGLWDFPKDLPVELPRESLREIGKADVQYVVTRHRVHRTCRVWRVDGEAPTPAGWQWIPLREPPKIPAGSTLGKTLRKILPLSLRIP